MDLNFNIFREPRGFMRLLQFLFSICAFAIICDYAGTLDFSCKSDPGAPNRQHIDYAYPFDIYLPSVQVTAVNHTTCNASIKGDFSSDAQFFVATGVLAFLFSIVACVVYLRFDPAYQIDRRLPMADFCGTVVLAVLWLSASAAWANGLSGLKGVTERATWMPDPCVAMCQVERSAFGKLNVSVIFGFLNFFLWAADLWFLYKETTWFGPKQTVDSSSPAQNGGA